MDNAHLRGLQRAEVLARLTTIDRLIAQQRARISQNRSMGWDTLVSEQRLRLLVEARQLHCMAFAAVYGKDVLDEPASD